MIILFNFLRIVLILFICAQEGSLYILTFKTFIFSNWFLLVYHFMMMKLCQVSLYTFFYKIAIFKISLFLFMNPIFTLAFPSKQQQLFKKFKQLCLFCFCLPLTIFLSSSPGILYVTFPCIYLFTSWQHIISFQLLLPSYLLVIQVLL